MPIYLIDKIKQKNEGTFKLMDAIDVETSDGSSVQEKLDNLIDNSIKNTVDTYDDLPDVSIGGLYIVRSDVNNQYGTSLYYSDGTKYTLIGGIASHGIDGREVEFSVNETHIIWKYAGEEDWINLISIDSLKGEDGHDGQDGVNGVNGREIHLQVSDTHIQWQYVGDDEWIDLIPLESLKGEKGEKGEDGVIGQDGREVEIGVIEETISWRYAGEETWNTIVPLSSLKGEKGDQGEKGEDSNVPELIAGDNIEFEIDEINNTITIHASGGGEGGTTDYSDLENKPSINGKLLEDNVTLTFDDIEDGEEFVGFTVEERDKLSGIDENANKYEHPIGDGYSHVPETGTTNMGKFLGAGNTEDSAEWKSITGDDVTLDTNAFEENGNLDSSITTVQKLAERVHSLNLGDGGSGTVTTNPPYTNNFTIGDWDSTEDGNFNIAYNPSKHGQGYTKALLVQAYETDSVNKNVYLTYTISSDGIVTLKSNTPFNGFVIISNLNGGNSLLPGGTQGQIPVKQSIVDGDFKWQDIDELNASNNINLDINKVECPFKPKLFQLKGQMHCHTTTSDGALSPTDLLTRYKNAGYDFVAITDHDAFNLDVDVDGILHIRSVEFLNGANHSHICAYNIEKMRDLEETLPSNQGVIDFAKSNGALVSFPHPTLNYNNLMSEYDDLINLSEYDFVEIYGYEKKDDGDFIDILLSNGKKINILATDDYHNDASTPLNSGWIIVNSDTKSKDDILAEIKNGNYYSSNGNDISISKNNNIITATSSSASNFIFITNKGNTTVSNVTSASYALTGLENYIRVVSVRVSDSKKAWSNPIFLKNVPQNKENKNMFNMEQIYKKIPLIPYATPIRNKFIAVNNFTNGSYEILDNGSVLFDSGNVSDGTGCGIEYSIYNPNLCNKTLTFSGIVEKVSGTGSIEVFVFASNGTVDDVLCTTNRITKTQVFNLSVGQKQMFKIDFNMPYGYTGFACYVRQSVANNSFKVSDLSLSMYQRTIITNQYSEDVSSLIGYYERYSISSVKPIEHNINTNIAFDTRSVVAGAADLGFAKINAYGQIELLKDGIYDLQLRSIVFEANATGDRTFTDTGGAIFSFKAPTSYCSFSNTVTAKLNAGYVLPIAVLQNSGSSLNIISADVRIMRRA